MKLKRQSFTLLLLILCAWFACKKEENPMDKEITIEDIEKSFNQIDLTPGIKDVELEVSNGVFWNFRVIVPDVDMNKKWPLVMSFHGASGGSPDAHKSTECYVEPGFADLSAFIIHPNAGEFEWYEDVNQNKVIILLQLATKYWPINFDRIVASGYSNGGNATWLFAELAPHIFSAGVAMASSYDLRKPDSTGRKIDIPMYVIHGEGDELFPINITRNWVNLSIAAGSDITFVEAKGLTHFKPCEYVPYIKDAVMWLKDDVWK